MINPASLLQPDAFLSPLAIEEAVQRALDEDLGRAGDITSIAAIPETTPAHAIMVARQAGVIAGLPLAVATLQKLSADINIQAHVRDGAAVANGAHVLTISGPARAVLAGDLLLGHDEYAMKWIASYRAEVAAAKAVSE